MSKAVLVLDQMPEFCGKCKLCVLSRTEFAWGCVAGPGAGWQPIDAYAMSRPEWCPLKEAPIPHKYEATVGYNSGYNAALKDMGVIDDE